MNGVLCRDCGRDHETGNDGLRCSVAISKTHREGCECLNCKWARWWLAEIEAGRG